MRKMVIVMLALITILVLCSCTEQKVAKPTEATPTQPAPTTPSEPTQKEYPNLIETKAGEGFLTPESLESNTPCQVRVLKVRDLEKTEELYYDLCIEVNTGTETLNLKLIEYYYFAPEFDELRFADVDGDSIEEIFLCHDTGGIGGFGVYCNWVLKVDGDDIRILYEDPKERSDVGFKSRMIDGYQMEVTNELTGYQLVFEARKYDYYAFDENGKVNHGDYSFFMDSLFYEFVPQDWDNDGTDEILAKRYTSFISRADYIGTACCILEFNMQSQQFEVVEAWYEPAEDVNVPIERQNADQ